MRHFLLIFALLIAPVAALAQSQEEQDKGYLAQLIEDNLSGAGRQVNIIGFAGALSSEATIDRLTIADTDGVWLTLEGIVLTWSRAALLRGQIDVQELSAARIVVARAPVTQASAGPAPEAQPFSLPELPVGISIDKLNIDRIELSDVFLGEPIAIRLSGSAQLADGQGAANVLAQRLDGKAGAFELIGSYANETQLLGLSLKLEEGPDGIAARLLDLPGRPAVRLEIAGTAPTDSYAATLAVATDGQDRLNGTFGITTTDAGRRIQLDLGGDVSPLFAPEYQAFFGTSASLTAEALLADDGRIDISELELQAQRLNLSGAIRVGAQGWPTLIRLTGGINAADGVSVLLPLTGPKTFVDGASLAINYDTSQSDDWQADITVRGLQRPGLGIGTITAQGGGILQPGEGDLIGQVTANLRYGATGVQLDDAAVSRAFGNAVTGEFVARRVEGAPIRISRFTLNGAGLNARAEATIDGPKSGLRTQATANVTVAGLDRFSTLVGQDLGGAAEIAIRADLTPLDGLFNIVLNGTTRDLSVGMAQADAVLAGAGRVTANAVRDTDGTRLETLRIQTPAALITATAALTSAGSEADFDARLDDIALVAPGITGPATARGTVTRDATGVMDFKIAGTGPAATVDAAGTVNPAEVGQTITAAATVDVTDLARYATIAGRPLSGAAKLYLRGALVTDGLRFDVNVDAQTTDLTTGVARVDPLLAGQGRLSAAVAGSAANSLSVSALRVTTPALTLSGDASVQPGGPTSADIALKINDAAVFDPSLSGPLTVSINAEPAPDDAVLVAISAVGPGATVRLDATVASPADDYAVTGDLSGQIADLAAYRALVGQPVAGQVDVAVSGTVLPDLSGFDAKITLRSEDLAIGNPSVDVLLRGTGRVNATVGLADDILSVRTLEVTTPQVSVVGALNGNAGIGQGRFNASLRDVGVLTDQISGPVRATGMASLDQNGNWGIDAKGTGPGGLQAQITGQISQTGQLNITIDGSAPLALANTAIDPRRLSGTANFDLAVNGPPQLSSLSGQVTFANGRLAAPTLAQALEDIGGAIRLSGGAAQLDLRANVESGGDIAITGPIAFNAPNTADVTLRLGDVVLKDPSLYTTTVSGAITLTGPLQGGARVAGRLALGQTDIQVPSSSISTLGALPDVLHIGADAAVRRTLQRAGVVNGGGGGAGAAARPGRAYPLDIVIDAPSRIFIRGRGLDAELGGRLTIGGTTASVIPVGRFDLLRGRIDILQQRFNLTEGSASLQGDFVPYIRLVAATETPTGTTINIVVEGPASEPEVSFVSTPELPQDEVLSQLIFGRNLDSISPFQAIQLASAISTLAGRGGGALDRLRRNIGLDDFDVTTDDEGATAVRVGKYLSENIYTDVTITSEGDTEINLNLDLTDEITAKGSVDQDGQTSVGVFFERDY
ncbi:translocation/assembly module TamB domain-containing protein [Yoonia sp.]|uniref:translocation/assembly module TamB domain-containing protein n=1 Tax=Yoonia sp. TaxID=2212373 RepID=UPI0025D2A270|nr:translocation/assembly module TamB domain-containing protein [Yoonia sp.]